MHCGVGWPSCGLAAPKIALRLYNPRKGEPNLKMNGLKRLFVLTLCLIALAAVGTALAQQLSQKLQNAVGRWQTFNDGKPAGQVETYLVNGQLFGRVTQVRPGRTPQDICDKCSGDLKNKMILGMVIMRGFHPEGDDWVGGTVVDPENGKEYQGKVWSEGKDDLSMRGFIGISLLGRTAKWKRMP